MIASLCDRFLSRSRCRPPTSPSASSGVKAARKRAGPSGVAATAVVVILFACGAVRGQGTDVTPFTLTALQADEAGRLSMAQVNSGHGCKGGNMPPTLQWSAAPAGTKGFAVTMVDLTANKGAGFWHWALFDVPPDARMLEAKQLPDGARTGRNDFGDAGYGGVCPPPGPAHQYQLTVWAMGEATLSFDAGSSDKEIGDFLKGHALGHADLVLTYKR